MDHNPTFLEELAQRMVVQHGDQLGDLLMIFPNRRAGLFFREALRQQVKNPIWAPTVMPFQEFVTQQSPTTVADSLTLVHHLYDVYYKVMKGKEGFDRFYFWGQLLLKDFDEIDKYLVDATHLYTNLSRQKQLDLTFDYLSEEQKALIRHFWHGFEDTKSAGKDRFMEIWENLGKVYSAYNAHLNTENIAYEGMQYKALAHDLDEHLWQGVEGPVVFAGFNALTLSEEKIIAWLVQNKNAQVVWDVDAYYVDDKRQEAGHFFREYKSKQVFSSSFPAPLANHFKEQPKVLSMVGAPQHIGQARIVGEAIQKMVQENPKQDLTKVAIVLADEALLFPVLHVLSSEVTAVNVTMGFPLAFAPVNSLIEHILELQQWLKQDAEGFGIYHFKPTISILRHPTIRTSDAVQTLIHDLEKNNRVFVRAEDVAINPVLEVIFQPGKEGFVPYLTTILEQLYHAYDEEASIEKEYIHHYYKLLNRYSDILNNHDEQVSADAFARLFRQLVHAEKIPFSGEPLKGLQVMGVMETRNLDFEHIFVLSVNEDFFPATGRNHSFIPYNLRKGYNMPHYDQQDAMYAYLFYRLIQRAQSVCFLYNTEGNDMGGQEMSRFLHQLIHESGLAVTQQVLANPTGPEVSLPITITKDDTVMQQLTRYTVQGNQKSLSPSALNTYMDCRLKFYYRYVARLYEKDEISENVDARTLGSVLHDTMEILYLPYTGKSITTAILSTLKKELENAIVAGFRKFYQIPTGRPFKFEGKNLIAKEVVRRFAHKILDLDATYAPFELVGVEKNEAMTFPLDNELVVILGGQIDRIDSKQGVVRVIDYKTGMDKQGFKNIEGLFQAKDRNKAAFQTFCYALMYEDSGNNRIMPVVFNKNALFLNESSNFTHKEDSKEVLDMDHYVKEFQDRLKQLLQEIYDRDQPFEQTEDINKCKGCAYNVICNR